MTKHDIVVLGLPGSGKTTFLAALWHLLTSNEVETKLSLVTLKAGEVAHLNEIASLWRKAKVQERTLHAGDRTVTMSMRTGTAPEFQLSFPDLAGESFQQMWETRECASEVAASLRSSNVLLFIHADKIKAPGWIIDDAEDAEAAGLPVEAGKPVPWNARLAPTQVKLVDLLQSLRAPPLEGGRAASPSFCLHGIRRQAQGCHRISIWPRIFRCSASTWPMASTRPGMSRCSGLVPKAAFTTRPASLRKMRPSAFARWMFPPSASP